MSGGNTYQPKWRFFVPLLLDTAVLYGSLLAALYINIPIAYTHTYRLYNIVFTPLFIYWLAIMRMVDLYELRTVRELPGMLQNLLVTAFAIWVLGSGYMKIVDSRLPLVAPSVLVLTILISLPFLIAARRAWLRLCDFHLEDQKVVFLGDRDHVRILQEGLERLSPETGFAPVDWHSAQVDLVVADAQWVDHHWEDARDVFLDSLSRKIPIISFESFYESLLGKVSPEYASSPSWTLQFALHESKSLYPMMKRVMDASISSILLVLASPLFMLIATAIYVFDGAPVFYRQRRVGYLCREFNILKFRTMKTSAESEGPFTSAKVGDSLVTPVGRWLRRFRLDELPQLWNVLKGDMSLVGPRPEWTEEVRLIGNHIANYHIRHLVQPGITGWAQVYFRATNNFQDSAEKFHYDLYYVKYFSAALDISILLKTIKRLFVSDASLRHRRSLVARSNPIIHRWANDFPLVAASIRKESPRRRPMDAVTRFITTTVMPGLTPSQSDHS